MPWEQPVEFYTHSKLFRLAINCIKTLFYQDCSIAVASFNERWQS